MLLKLLPLLLCLPLCRASGQDLPQMIVVEGGTFTMGDDTGNKDEKPSHVVRLRTFRMAKTETTVGQWRLFCRETNRRMPEVPWFGLTDEQPIVNVSWDHAVAYCYWLSAKNGKHFRLPTEAEWEFAARGGVHSKGFTYSGSNIADSVAWLGNKSKGPAAVAKKLPNEIGLYDMTGNVWEWCSDFYDAKYYAVSEKENPKGPAAGMFYSLRGGAWDQGAYNNRIYYRNPLSPSSRNHNKGFRVAAD